jgi:alanyl-tRNA synthetase
LRRFPKDEYHVPFFDEYSYVRKLCSACKEYFWTQNADQKTCGELAPEEPSPYTFIHNPLTRKRYSIREMREAFLSFFEKQGHERIKPYPVVARWRDDLYLTHASIIDFQPYVTNGISPPPANPLVISQPCIRLVDVDNTGLTFGRHLTIFEMGGHHAFNYPDKEVYWKDQTVRYHHEFVTKELGIKSEEVVYKEDVWSGGGNAGPDLETVIGGLELATLVFMKFKVVNGEFIELPIRTVDTGYGIERFTWLSQGSISCFHAVYGSVLNKVLDMADVSRIDNQLLTKVAKLSGIMSLKGTVNQKENRRKVAEKIGMSLEELEKTLLPIENAFAVVDHTKCLSFMLSEGIVPSNVREGYLARLLLRRTYRLLRALAIEEKLLDIVDMQIEFWSKDFPRLKDMRNEILEILSAERDKFEQTLKRGGFLVKRIAQGLKAKGISEIPLETLTELYDSHGLPPEVVRKTAEAEDVKVRVPENFYTMVAEKHVQAPPSREEEKMKELESMVSDLPETKMLYYEDPYLSEFEAKVLKVLAGQHVILEETAFYPEGGGQPADHGYLTFDKKRSEVVDVQKIGNVIIHVVKGPVPQEGGKVKGVIDWEQRSSYMKHHTSTHLIMGAARRVLGEHVWQAGSQKGAERSRLDISHFKRLTKEEIHEIERLANQAVIQNIPVETMWMPREQAEKKYGFRLYQGGVVPGREIRVVKTGDWDVEACGGTHLKNTGEIGFIKIIRTERIQDGVERIVFSAGLPALKAVQENERLLWKVAETLNAPVEKLGETVEHLVKEWKEARREKKRLLEEIAKREARITVSKEPAVGYGIKIKQINEVKFATQEFESVDVDRMIKTASELVKKNPEAVAVFYGTDKKTARIVVMAGKDAVKRGVNSSEIAKEAAAVLGGGGSGRLDFAQGGGTRIKKVSAAIQKAEEVLRKQLERKK